MLVGHAQQVGQTVRARSARSLVVDDDGVVEVSTLDEVVLYEGLYLSHKDKGACTGNLFLEVVQVVEAGKLVASVWASRTR